jgi:hypothetical protein
MLEAGEEGRSRPLRHPAMDKAGIRDDGRDWRPQRIHLCHRDKCPYLTALVLPLCTRLCSNYNINVGAPTSLEAQRGAMNRAAFISLLLVAVAGCVAKDHEAVVALVRHISRGDSPQADFDSVRQFIQTHSVHRNNDELNSIREKRAFAREMLKHVTGARTHPVPMICGARARLMYDLLEEMGYDAQVVHIFDADSSASHTFLRVLNPQTGKWETQDPDKNLFWRNAKSGTRISVIDYAPDQLDQVEPCNAEGCGWDVATGSNKLRGLFDRVKIDN